MLIQVPDIETMPRKDLEAFAYDMIARFEGLTTTVNEDMAKLKLFLPNGPSGQPQVAKLICELMRGGLKSNERLFSIISKQEMEHVKSISPTGRPEINSVIVCRARKALKPHGIEIKAVWGQGYMMPRESIDKLKALIAEVD